MRNFLPTTGPGGRTLTPREKAALVILGVTLVLCLLTLLAGASAYSDQQARNPVFALVALVCRAFGGGIVGFYALVLTWSGLIYFKGERIARISPVGGRMLAGFGVMVGISGALGIGKVETAGSLGLLVGGALGNTLGGTVAITFLLALILLGIHLAGQGAWCALRESAGAGMVPASPPREAGEDRMSHEPPLPDDGDPTSDERHRAVIRAMEEIERSQGVTIVDVEPTRAPEPERPSIGEEVEAAPEPAPETEEADVRRGLERVSEALAEEPDEIPHPLLPVPLQSPEGEGDEEEEEEEEPRVYYPTYEVVDASAVSPEPAIAEESGFALTDAGRDELQDETPQPAPEQVDREQAQDDQEEELSQEEPSQEDPSEEDPYARGGLIKRLEAERDKHGEEDLNRPYASFDWRGRPLD